MPYRIRNWSKHFENNKSRSVEACRYVCMPNKQDGLGLMRILACPDGAAIFGIWCLILQACSRQTKREGWLTDDGTANGRPWDLDDLALRWRRSLDEIQRCLDVVCGDKIGWMEHLDDKCPPSARSVQPTALAVPSRCLEGREGKEGKEGKADGQPAGRPADEDPAEDPTLPAAPQGLTDERIARDLAIHVHLRFKDPERTDEARRTVVYLSRTYGHAKACQAADAAHKASRGKIYPEELEAALASADQPPAEQHRPQQWSLDDMAKAYPVVAAARALVAERGWEWARTTWGYTAEQLPSEAAALEVLRTDIPASEELVRKAGAKATA